MKTGEAFEFLCIELDCSYDQAEKAYAFLSKRYSKKTDSQTLARLDQINFAWKVVQIYFENDNRESLTSSETDSNPLIEKSDIETTHTNNESIDPASTNIEQTNKGTMSVVAGIAFIISVSIYLSNHQNNETTSLQNNSSHSIIDSTKNYAPVPPKPLEKNENTNTTYIDKKANQDNVTSKNASVVAQKIPDENIREIQSLLNRLGYNSGPTDGLVGKKTKSAVQKYLTDNGLDATNLNILNFKTLLEKQVSKNVAIKNQIPPNENDIKSRINITPQGKTIPKNAKLNYYKDGWVCNAGYYKSGNQCAAVVIPKNAKLNYYKDDWVCNAGYYKSGNQCAAVVIPKNAKLNYYKDDWVCNAGYYKSGNQCAAVVIPKNAKLNYYKDGWVCNAGYYKSGNQCAAVVIPKNAKLNYYKDDWVCNAGYYKSGNQCAAVVIPKNAKLNYYKDDWVCNAGYYRSGNQCVVN